MAGLFAPSRALRVLVPLALAASAACSDAPTSPAAAPDAASARSFARSTGFFHTGKYRDTGLRNATGRAGSATLAARAVLWRDGVVRLLVTTGDLDDPAAAPGELAKVQLKLYSAEGALLSVINHQRPTSGGSHVFLLPGLAPDARIRIQANVRGIDRNRTGVVTITETVKLPPAISAVLDPLPEATPGIPAVVTATVREVGGLVGTYTSCTLWVDGVAVDRIDRVWVDAGDAVSCAFTHTFERAGSYQVSVTTGDPAGVGTLLPEPATGTLDVAPPAPMATYHATVLDRTVATRERFEQSWWKPDGSRSDYAHDNGEASRTQTATLTGTLARAAAFPLASVRLRLASTEGEWQTAAWSALADATVDGQGRSCVDRFIPEHGGHFYLCTLGGATAFGYTRYSGTVTYHSIGSYRTWGGPAGEGGWTWNEVAETYSAGGQRRPLGTAVTMTLEIEDGTGSVGVSGTVPIDAFEEPVVGGEMVCREESPYWLEGGVMTTCESASSRVFGWRGEASG